MSLATLEIEFLANIARLKQDLDEVKSMFSKTQSHIESAAGKLNSVLGMLGVGLSVGAFAAWMKAAIDAGDQMKEFSQKTGVAVKDVAGLQLAFSQGNVSGDELGKSIAKLSKNMAEGNEAFKSLGVETRNSDGSLRGVKDVLYDVADATAVMADGAGKTALLQEIFGKSAAALIPTLNEGSEGMREMADMAEKLGLSMSAEAAENADKFNDTMELVGDSTKGIARQVMAELLPTLNNLAGVFLTSATEGDRLQSVSNAIAAGLKGLFSVGIGVAEVFTTVGKSLGAAGAALMALVNRDFQGAKNIISDLQSDISKDWSDSGAKIQQVWSDSSNKTVAALAAVNAKGKEAVVQTKEQKDAVKEADKAYGSWQDKLNSTRNELQQQISNGDKLTKTQQMLAQLTANNTDEVKKLSDARRQELIEIAKNNVALEKEAIAHEEARKATEKLTKEISNKNETLDSEIQKQLESNAKLKDGEAASVALEVAKLREAAATAQKNAVTAQEANQDSALAAEYQKQADKLRELADLKEQGVHLEMAKQSADEWKKTTDSIENGLTDSLMRGFENGKSFAESFKDGLEAEFKALVLKPTIQAIMQPVSQGLGSIFGGGGGGLQTLGNLFNGTTGTFGSVGSIAQMLGKGASQLGSMFGSTGLQGFGGGLSTGMSNGTFGANMGVMAGKAMPIVGGYMIGNGINSAISGDYKISNGFNTFEKVGTAVASAFFGPIGGAVAGAIGGVVNRAFGMGAKKVGDSGIEGSIGAGDATGKTYADWKQKGGWFRKDKHGTDYGSLDDNMSQALDSGALTVYQQTLAWADALKLPGERLATVTSDFKVKLGDNAEENQAAITKVFSDYQGSLANQFSASLAPFRKAGESLIDTMGRLAQLQTVSAGLNEFGGVFSRIASLSVDAREQLIDFAGGIDALVGKTKSFVDAYYTDAEKFGLQSKQVAAQLQGLGVDPATLQTREQYRALVESQDVNTEEGRKMLAALLDIAPSFAGIADYLTQNKMTLDQSAAQAPQTALLQSLFDQSKTGSDAMVDQQSVTNDNLVSIEDAIRSGNTSMIAALMNSSGAISEAIARSISSAVNTSRAVVPA